MGQEIFSVMRGGAGMGQEKSMRGGDEDPILRPRSAPLPSLVHMANHKVTMYQDKDNEEQLHLNLDLIDKIRTDTEERTARYKNLMARQHDAMLKPRRFNIGDLVLKKVSLATKNPTHGKLGPNWEGPYRIINCKRQGSYYLEALDGRKLEHHWNVEHLRTYYQ